MEKKPIDSQRLRCLPKAGFSWIDRRVVRDGFLEDLPPEAILLYFFLVAVSDAQGLSFYADPTVTRLLKLDAEVLTQSRFWLQKANLVTYRYPLYQVLALPPQRVALNVPAHPSSSTAPRRKPAPTPGGEDKPISFRDFVALLAREDSVAQSQPVQGEP